MRMPALNIPVKIAISFGIVALLLSRMDLHSIGDQIAQVQVSGLFWGGLFILAQIGLLAWRWADLMNIAHDGPTLTYKQSLKITLASLLANVLFITSISGLADAIRRSKFQWPKTLGYFPPPAKPRKVPKADGGAQRIPFVVSL